MLSILRNKKNVSIPACITHCLTTRRTAAVAEPKAPSSRQRLDAKEGAPRRWRTELHGGSSSRRKELHAVVDPRTWGCRIA
ncbi:Os03g0686600 [Oryza sativa Japonica Group]|uniref:Os03g0686600 protein n=1 Tax=Oryza sativa subsp. japonica TaxID=39947 RepID=A0A0P0W1I1_ORYSJ|nr:Os03g0686600 [Oryza sativa Japonica Group]